MGTTPKGAPYPDGSGLVTDGNEAMQALAEWVDGRPGIATLTTAERNALAGAQLWTGRVIYNTTASRHEQWDGSAWGVLVPNPTYDLLAEVVLGSAAANIDFQNIPQTYRHLRLVLTARCDRPAANEDSLACRFNNDSAAGRYQAQQFEASDVTVTAALRPATTLLELPAIPAINANAGDVLAAVIDIPNYRGTVWRKMVTGTFMERSTTVPGIRAGVIGGFWHGTDAINRITLTTANAANFVAGSVVSLYGVKGS